MAGVQTGAWECSGNINREDEPGFVSSVQSMRPRHARPIVHARRFLPTRGLFPANGPLRPLRQSLDGVRACYPCSASSSSTASRVSTAIVQRGGLLLGGEAVLELSECRQAIILCSCERQRYGGQCFGGNPPRRCNTIWVSARPQRPLPSARGCIDSNWVFVPRLRMQVKFI